LVRVIGGAGKDQIADDSRAPGLRALTKVYDTDTPGTDLAAGPETDDHRSTSPNVNLYDRGAFEFHSYAPRAGLFYNRNDGFGLSLGLSFLRQGFRKPDYKTAMISTCRPRPAGSFSSRRPAATAMLSAK
jgi:hypothetical protein